MNNTVDVVIPAFNAAHHIVDTVRLIGHQQLPVGWQLNIYVSDDGSSDDTRELLSELQRSTHGLHLVGSDSNSGRSLACNRGVAAGSGDVVVICDADCRYSRVEAIAEFLGD